MKHRWIYALLLAVSLLCVLPLTGCVTENPPPFEFVVESKASLEALRSAAELTDEEFEAWRKAQIPQDLYGSPVTREQAQKSLALLDAVGYPLPEDGSYESMSLSFRPFEEYISVVYRMDGIRYRFIISPCQKEVWQFGLPALRCQLDGTALRLYRSRRRNLVGYLYTGDYRIQVVVMDNASRKAVDFAPFLWQGGTWKQG